jgi:transketolase
MAAGMAYALKVAEDEARVFVLIGDGEANEGSVWETALVASQHDLSNLTCIIDDNRSSARAINMGNIGKKFASFGWDVSAIDGHDWAEINSALQKNTSRPHAIVATTVKGRGIDEMESNPAWHHTRLSEADYSRFLEELA